MIEELKIIAEIFSKTTNNALYAYLVYIIYNLAKISLIVFPIVSLVKFTVNRVFRDEA